MKKKNGPNHSVITAYQNAPSLYRNNCEDKRKGLCPNGLSQSFEGQKSKMALNGLKSRCQQDCTPSGGSKGKKIFFFSFPVSRGPLRSLADGFFLSLQSPPWQVESFPHQITETGVHCNISFFLPFLRIIVITSK